MYVQFVLSATPPFTISRGCKKNDIHLDSYVCICIYSYMGIPILYSYMGDMYRDDGKRNRVGCAYKYIMLIIIIYNRQTLAGVLLRSDRVARARARVCVTVYEIIFACIRDIIIPSISRSKRHGE